MQRRAMKSYPPDIWTREENKETGHFEGNEKPQDCASGMWACKKKRMLKHMLKTALMKSEYNGRDPTQVSHDACPPGVWTCSTGKRSEIIKEVEVVVAAS